jgi:hypothetical protein
VAASGPSECSSAPTTAGVGGQHSVVDSVKILPQALPFRAHIAVARFLAWKDAAVVRKADEAAPTRFGGSGREPPSA